MPPFFVLQRVGPSHPWTVISTPLAAPADAAAIVRDALALQPGARLAVVDVVRSFRGAVQVNQDPAPDVDP